MPTAAADTQLLRDRGDATEAFRAGTTVALTGPMKTLRRAMTLGLMAVCFSVPAKAAKPPAAPPAAAPSSVEIWIRGSGPLQADKAPRARSQALNLDLLPLVDSQRFDAQYGASHAFRGIALANVIASFAPDPSLDVAILHFANGMAVPIPFRDAAVMKRLDPFVARGMETHAKGPVRAAFFTEIRRKGTAEDPRPIVFSGNKLVVPVLWHPAVAAAAQPAFSPWRHVDTLTSIELVASRAYYGQFDVGGGAWAERGLALYQGELPVLPRRAQGGRPVRLGLRRAHADLQLPEADPESVPPRRLQAARRGGARPHDAGDALHVRG